MNGVSRRRVDDAVIAFTAARAAELAGISLRRLLRMEESGLVRPSVKRPLSERNTVRLYDFTDLQALMVAVLLVDRGHGLHHVNRIIRRLRDASGYAHPLKELKFAVDGRGRIYFKHPDGSWEGEDRRDQIVIEQTIPLAPINARIRRAAKQPRSHNEAGRLEQRRRVFGSKDVFKGTRIPVDSVVDFIRAGATDREILEAFPRLKPPDLRLARKQAAKAS